MRVLKVAIAQVNTTVGDLDGNAKKVIEYMEKARKDSLVVFPELTLTGYPPKDLLLKPDFIEKNKAKLDEVVKVSKGVSAVVGFVDSVGKKLYNAAAVMSDGKLLGVQHKTHLPNYDVFDEVRYFKPAEKCQVFEISGVRVGVNVCEDIWIDDGPSGEQVKQGAQLIINISASPFHAGKTKVREELVSRRARENNVPVVYCNLVGGQDDLVFDGRSYAFNSKGVLIAVGKHFEEDLLIVEPESGSAASSDVDPLEEIYKALLLGIRDYTLKNGFKSVVLGVSGGIDSSLTATLAARALGPDNVLGVSMPSKHSSEGSLTDAQQLVKNLGIKHITIPIKDTAAVYDTMLAEAFKGTKPDVAEENIQARIRGNILMALSNKFGHLVLSTGNKSESAVGYATLYGDMAGGFAAISDVPKTTVYRLAEWINKQAGKDVIPRNTIEKEPSAELSPGQKDSDALPKYEILDPILHAYIEENKSREEIIKMGFAREVVEDVIRRVDGNEYKRQQAPIGPKITPKAFGFGRRMPITNRYEG